MTDEQRERRKVIFSGRVQGVGFRYTTVALARKYPVAGYVRNVPDGTVELVAEGDPKVLDRFLADVEEAMRGYIQQRQVVPVEAREPLRGFTVRY